MKVSEIISVLEEFASPSLQESYDNSGLIVGNKDQEVTKVLISLDCIESVVEEAIKNKANLIVSHHPILFKGIKQLNGKNYVERTILKAIKNDIALYAIHTNLDNVFEGVNFKIAEKLGLKNCRSLRLKENNLAKLSTFVPIEHKSEVVKAIYAAGAGKIGNYSECSFSTEGIGTFKALENALPFVGSKGVLHSEAEEKLEVIVPMHLKSTVVNALLKAHPYEEVAYDLYPLLNSNPKIGSGYIGETEKNIPAKEFLQNLKNVFKCEVIKHTKLVKKNITKVALCGGSGSFLLADAKRAGADIFISADFKYHEFFDAENDLIIADIGHYESEQYTIDHIHGILKQKFPNFALLKSGVSTNPVKYL
ncbi:MAG: dinuclear metal center YbgI/SA1388 family protein [Sphingobacteriales bacterium]|jgi:dinuclear metal center YbgI/SA1388 family protein